LLYVEEEWRVGGEEEKEEEEEEEEEEEKEGGSKRGGETNSNLLVVDVNECASSPCLGAATCSESTTSGMPWNQFKCTCDPGTYTSDKKTSKTYTAGQVVDPCFGTDYFRNQLNSQIFQFF
jgi:hypothetical protein